MALSNLGSFVVNSDGEMWNGLCFRLNQEHEKSFYTNQIIRNTCLLTRNTTAVLSNLIENLNHYSVLRQGIGKTNSKK